MQYRVTLTFTEPLLGTAPMDADVYTNYIAEKKADLTPDELNDEVDSLNEDKGVTGFHAQDGRPFLYDYMIRGFFKDACGMLRRAQGTASSKLTAYKRIIDGLVFVDERRIFLELAEPLTTLERPLRAQTAQGERVAPAKSECAPAGATASFTVTVLDDKSVPETTLCEWLDYGRRRGLGQWRNGGYGRFTYELTAL